MEKALKNIPIKIVLSMILVVIAACPAAYAAPESTAELIMFEQDGCEWCEVWNEQIAPIFPKTPEGKCASFQRVDIHDESAGLLQKVKPIVYTPTFVVMENGKEVGRVLGYAGEDFFWFLLREQLRKLAKKCFLPD